MKEPQIRATGIGAGATPVPFGENSKLEQCVEKKFLEYFGLNEQPFGVTPDPRFLCLGSKHKQALTALNYGTELNRGFLTLIAPPGMGKTSLLFSYLEGLRNTARTVFLFQTDCDSRELMSYILADLGHDPTGKGMPEMHFILNQVLTEQMHMGRRFVVVIDEAQNLSERVLESIRLLSNFETPWTKLIHIVLAGQPQLAERLAKPSMAQFRQRISFAIQIEPLVKEEVSAYVDHRLWVGGYKGAPLFNVGARTFLAECSEGIPRKINNLCFCAMSLAWATNKRTIDREMMRDVLAEANLGSPKEIVTPTPKAFEHKPKHRAAQNLHPKALTVNDAPPRSWAPRLVAICALILVLGWSGLQVGIGNRFMTFLRGISAAGRNSSAPVSMPAHVDSAIQMGPDTTSSGPTSEAPDDDKALGVPQNGDALTKPLGREPD